MLKTCFQHEWIEAGCDEAGRGPLAGPVTAAAVILPPEWNHPLLNDSKKMSEKNRNLLRKIIEKEAVAWAVEMVMPDEIDRINILNASFAAMSRAVEKLSVKPQLLLIDGNRFRSNLNIPYQCIVKGDATFTSIAAASVLAKTLDKGGIHVVYLWCKWNRNPRFNETLIIELQFIASYSH